MVKTRIACYFDIPRGDNTADYQNFVDIDLRPRDSKNDLKRKVAAKTGVPMERLRMRLGPFNEVHLFEKQSGCIIPKSNGISVAMRDTMLAHAPKISNFGATDAALGLGEHPYARWAQTWEDVEPHLVK